MNAAKCFALWLIALLIAAAPATQPRAIQVKADAPDDVKKYVAYAISIRSKLVQSAVLELQIASKHVEAIQAAHIGAAADSITDDNAQFTTLQSKQAALADAKAIAADWKDRLAEIKDPQQVPDCPLIDYGTTGGIGLIAGFKVEEVLDAHSLLGNPIKCDHDVFKHDVILDGVDTAGMVDHSTVSRLWMVRLAGTDQFKTPDEADHTVRKMSIIDITDWIVSP